MVCTELFGHLFSFLLPLSPQALIEHFKTNAALMLTNFRPGPPVQSATGEGFRDVLCEVHDK